MCRKIDEVDDNKLEEYFRYFSVLSHQCDREKSGIISDIFYGILLIHYMEQNNSEKPPTKIPFQGKREKNGTVSYKIENLDSETKKIFVSFMDILLEK